MALFSKRHYNFLVRFFQDKDLTMPTGSVLVFLAEALKEDNSRFEAERFLQDIWEG